MIRQYDHEKDKGFLWAAYQHKSFELEDGLEREAFISAVAGLLSSFSYVLVIEDDHLGFKSGRGLVGVIGVKTDGWTFVPESLFFKWASKRNVLRASVAFLQMIRHQKEVGVCEVRTTKKDFYFMKHMQKYGLLYVRGMIPKGSAEGAVYIFSIEGKK